MFSIKKKKRGSSQGESAKQVLTHTDSTSALVESGACCGEVRTLHTHTGGELLLVLGSSPVLQNGTSTGAASQCAASTWDVDSQQPGEQPEVHLHFQLPHTQVQPCGGRCQQGL